MMLFYGLLRGISAMLRRIAEWKHNRAQAAYETAADAFGELELTCKAAEVAVGRPADYSDQLRLLKAYERREQTRARWADAARNVARRKSLEGRIRSFSDMRLPYTFGLIDMAFIMRILDHLGILPRLEQPVLDALYAMLAI